MYVYLICLNRACLEGCRTANFGLDLKHQNTKGQAKADIADGLSSSMPQHPQKEKLGCCTGGQEVVALWKTGLIRVVVEVNGMKKLSVFVN